MSHKGKVNRGEKWLQIYSDEEIAKNPVMVEDVKEYLASKEKGENLEKPLNKMDKVELLKKIHAMGIELEDGVPVDEKGMIKVIRKAEKEAKEKAAEEEKAAEKAAKEE